MHTEVVILRCPNCDGEVDHIVRHNGIQAGGSSIGPSVMACPNCGAGVATGKSEWTEKHFVTKASILLTRVVWLLVGSLFIAGGLAGVVSLIAVDRGWIRPAQQTTWILRGYGVGTVILGAIFLRTTVVEIRESRRRTASADSLSE